MPAVPQTIEGSSVLHQIFRWRWPAWKKLPATQRGKIAQQASRLLQGPEAAGESALYSVLGHKGDLMLVHFRAGLEELNAVELQLARLQAQEFLEPSTSFLSVIELGLYDSSVKLYQSLMERGLAPHSGEWNAEVEEMLGRQREAMRPRLFPKIPPMRYLCFYPMDRRRGEDKNWYRLPIEERQRQMEEHGKVGRRYYGKVQQIITGSIGFDDWEWGVDLFADDPLVYVGVRRPAAQLETLLEGELPEHGV